MTYVIELSEKYVEKLLMLVGFSEEENSDLDIEDAIKTLIDNV